MKRIESNQVGIDTKLKGENEFEKIIRAWIRFCGRHTRLEKPISISRSEPTYSTLSYFLFGTGVRDFFYEPINGLVHGPAEFFEGLENGSLSLVRGVFVGVVRGAANVTGVLIILPIS